MSLWISLGALAAALALCVWGAALALKRPRVRLPDGSVLTYQEMTYGLTHRWLPKSWWQRLLGPLAPVGKGTAYPTYFYRQPNEKPYLVAWFTTPPPKLQPVMGWKSRTCFVADESGQEYGECQVMWQATPGKPVVEYVRVPMPPRGDRIELHFYDKTGDLMSPLTLSLPAETLRSRTAVPAGVVQASPEPPKPVSAKAAPVTIVQDGLAVQISEVVTGISGGGRNSSRPEVLLATPPRKVIQGELPWTRVAVRFPQGSQGWSLLWASANDGAGRHVTQSYPVHRRGVSWSAIPGYLALEGQPVSVSLLLERRREKYRAAEKWVISNLKLPTYGQETAINQTRVVQGARLKVHALAAAGTTTGLGRVDLEKKPYFRIHTEGISNERLLTVWTIDDKGRRGPADVLDMGGSDTPYDFRVRLNLARDARRVSLHLAVHPQDERKTVNCVVKPARP